MVDPKNGTWSLNRPFCAECGKIARELLCNLRVGIPVVQDDRRVPLRLDNSDREVERFPILGTGPPLTLDTMDLLEAIHLARRQDGTIDARCPDGHVWQTFLERGKPAPDPLADAVEEVVE
jgi:hypothetical protein